MRKLFLKILAFLLGFKDESYEELEKKGRKMRLDMINKQIGNEIPLNLDSIKEIYIVGAIEYSQTEMHAIRSKLLKSETHNFSFPNFDPSKDYINFYQVATYDNRYFIYASSDKGKLKDLNESLMMVEIKRKLPTEHLPADARYK